MSKCNFEISFTGGAEAVVEKLKTRIIAAKGSFEGAAESGNFVVQTPVGAVNGNYTISGQQLNIEITDKPVFVGCSVIESFIQKELA